MDQSVGVKTSDVGDAVTSPVSPLERPRTTLVRGSASRTTVKSSVVPVSLTRVPFSVSTTVIPATSSSEVVTLTI